VNELAPRSVLPTVGAAPVAIVTGGARGIGAAIAGRCVSDGDRVVICDIDDVAGIALAESLGELASYHHLDVTDEGSIESLVNATVARHGRLDRFFTNAGAVGVVGRIEATTAADWRSTVDLLLTSVFLGVKHAVRVMRRAGHGSIVCTASVASLRGGLGPHVYTAAKHGVLGLVESVAVEIAPDGLRINAVAPGGAVTSLAAGVLTDDRDDLRAAHRALAAASSSGVATTAEDVADAAVFLAGPRAARINGACLVVDGGDDVLAAKGRTYYR
jgi:NAD(P)-dependent dehydrogenase (short-subunit alcohol dehydrogenase family)